MVETSMVYTHPVLLPFQGHKRLYFFVAWKLDRTMPGFRKVMGITSG